ncbi:universal stress protein [Natrialba sp. PRR66]|uniref:universal stress protein n=1 Tax=Natrialba sp. PRR66 TaxID=3098146 RepID=UPI002B1E5D86|nr:universal stress protein [Natrialba sp. PRR66]
MTLTVVFGEFSDATVIALYVTEVPAGRWAQLVGPELQIPVTERAQEYADNVLESARETASKYGRSLEMTVAIGDPDHRIVATAEEEAVALIVVGSNGQEGISRVLLGTVAEKVGRRSPVPVFVVR